MSATAFPMLSVKDLPATKSFYEHLGFVETYSFPPGGEPAFVTLERDGVAVGVAVRQKADEDPFGYWVYVDDVDAAFTKLTRAGAPVVGEPRDEPWGERVASLRDPAGNLVHIGAAITTA